MFLIVTNQAGQEKQKKWFLNKPPTMWYYLSPLFQIHAKNKSTCWMYVSYSSVYSKKNLPNLDENHDYYILHDKNDNWLKKKITQKIPTMPQ